MAWENGIQVPFSLFFFAWHWKTDLNFVFRFNFVFIFASLWKRIWILFLVFASLWKTDLNFVFRFCMASLLKNRSEFRLSFFHDLKNGLLHQSSYLKSPDTPSRLTGAFTFSASESKWIFLSPGSKWVMNSSRPQWYVLTHTVLPFLTMQWMTNDMMITAKKHAAIATHAYPPKRRKMTNIWRLYNMKSQNAR